MKIVAHRGAAVKAPENTLPAFELARRLGADGVELDVQATADGEVIVFHDMTLDRTTDGTGPVFATPWATVEQLDAGAWFDPRHAGTPVPRLADVLALTGLELEIELKGFGAAFLDRVLETVAAARTSGPEPWIEYTTGNVALLARLRRLEPGARTGLFLNGPEPWMTSATYEHYVVGTAETAEAAVVHLPVAALTPRIVELLHALGLEVLASGADTGDQMAWAHQVGADRMSTAAVDRAVAIREQLRMDGHI